MLVDITTRSAPEFYVVSPDKLSQLVRRIGRKFAKKPKRDGTRRSIGFRKELPKALVQEWQNAWRLLGEPRGRPNETGSPQPKEDREWVDAPKVGRKLI